MANITSINGNQISLNATANANAIAGSVLMDESVTPLKLTMSSENSVTCTGVDINTTGGTITIRSNIIEIRDGRGRYITPGEFGTVTIPDSNNFAVLADVDAGSTKQAYVSKWGAYVKYPDSVFVVGCANGQYFSRFPLYVDGDLVLDGVFDIDKYARSVCAFERTVGHDEEQTGYMAGNLSIVTNSGYVYYVVPINVDDGAALIVSGSSNSAARIDRFFSGEPSASTYIGDAGITYPASYGTKVFDDYVMNLPKGTKYVVCSFLASAERSIRVLDVPDADDIADIASSAAREISGGKVDGVYAFTDKLTTLHNNKLYSRDGVETDYNNATTATLDVVAGEEVVVSGYTWSQQYGYWGYVFAANGAIISDTKYQGEAVYFSDLRVTVPEGADQIRVNGDASHPADVKAYRSITDFAECLAEIQGGGHDILYMGDSITQLGRDARGWPGMFHAMVNGMSYVNTAVVGARWCDYEDTVLDGNPTSTNDSGNTISNQVEKISRGKDVSNPNYSHVAEYDNFDTIIIAAGTNDVNTVEGFDTQFFVNGSAVQTNALDRMTWCGAIRYAYDKLRGMYPNADIFVCTPIQGYESTRAYDSINTKRDLIKRVCDRISDVVVIDTFLCGIFGVYEAQNNQGRDLIDGLHPNQSGAQKIARYNAREYKRFYGNDNG